MARNWFDMDGKPIARFNACLDVDISATPFTNTPINRIDWQPTDSILEHGLHFDPRPVRERRQAAIPVSKRR
jgi:hypothetical protein